MNPPQTSSRNQQDGNLRTHFITRWIKLWIILLVCSAFVFCVYWYTWRDSVIVTVVVQREAVPMFTLPLPISYDALENMRHLLPPSPSPLQLPVLWAGRKWDALNGGSCRRPFFQLLLHVYCLWQWRITIVILNTHALLSLHTQSHLFLVVNRHTDVHCLITYSFYRHIISPSFSLCLSAAHPHTPICHCIKVTFKRLDKDARQTCLIPQSCLPLIVSYFASNLHNITTKHTQIYRVIKPRFR